MPGAPAPLEEAALHCSQEQIDANAEAGRETDEAASEGGFATAGPYGSCNPTRSDR